MRIRIHCNFYWRMPSNLLIALIGISASSALVANVCRRAWKVNRRRPAAANISLYLSLKVAVSKYCRLLWQWPCPKLLYLPFAQKKQLMGQKWGCFVSYISFLSHISWPFWRKGLATFPYPLSIGPSVFRNDSVPVFTFFILSTINSHLASP